MTNEAFARIKIDQLLKDTDWRLTDGISVRYEYPLNDGGRADYALFDRQGRALAVLEDKSTSVSLSAGEAQGPTRYARGLGYVAMLKARDGERLRQRVLTVDGVGHDERRMFMSTCGLAALFGRPGCPARPPG